MTVRSRLVLTILGISVLMAAPAIYAVTQLSTLSELGKRQVNTHAAARVALGRLQTAMAELERFARTYILDPAEDQRAGLISALGVARTQLEDLSAHGYGPEVANAEAQLEAISEAMINVSNFMAAKRTEEATEYFKRVRPLIDNEMTEIRRI